MEQPGLQPGQDVRESISLQKFSRPPEAVGNVYDGNPDQDKGERSCVPGNQYTSEGWGSIQRPGSSPLKQDGSQTGDEERMGSRGRQEFHPQQVWYSSRELPQHSIPSSYGYVGSGGLHQPLLADSITNLGHQFPSMIRPVEAAPDSIGQQQPLGLKPRVSTTLWEEEGTLCFQVEARGISIARREDNNMINGTKLLNVAGMTRGRRDGILKAEKVRHVVKIGTMYLKGVWIPYERALEFAAREHIVDVLYPLFVADIKRFIYHPLNYTRTIQVLAAAERKRQNERYHHQQQRQPQQFLYPSETTYGIQQDAAFTDVHGQSKPMDAMERSSTVEHYSQHDIWQYSLQRPLFSSFSNESCSSRANSLSQPSGQQIERQKLPPVHAPPPPPYTGNSTDLRAAQFR